MTGKRAAPQNPQNLLLAGRGLPHFGQFTRSVAGTAAGRKGMAGPLDWRCFPHRPQMASVPGFGAPHAGHRI